MITPKYCQTMARYNSWQNRSLVAAADGLTDAARRLDRGAFFGSIFATFNHVLWGDTMWMSRLSDWPKPRVPAAQHAEICPDWETFKAERAKADDDIEAWANGLRNVDMTGDLTWHSGVLKKDVSMPVEICATHFFNHQTHHRGQIHGMLTAAGARAKLDDTDLFVMPDLT